MEKWIERIEATETLVEMNELVDEMAYDETITNDEYCELYGMAINKMMR